MLVFECEWLNDHPERQMAIFVIGGVMRLEDDVS